MGVCSPGAKRRVAHQAPIPLRETQYARPSGDDFNESFISWNCCWDGGAEIGSEGGLGRVHALDLVDIGGIEWRSEKSNKKGVRRGRSKSVRVELQHLAGGAMGFEDESFGLDRAGRGGVEAKGSISEDGHENARGGAESRNWTEGAESGHS